MQHAAYSMCFKYDHAFKKAYLSAQALVIETIILYKNHKIYLIKFIEKNKL